MINQIYRPIDAAVTSKGPHPTTSQSVISPIAENHVHDTSDNDIVTSVNDIINKPIPSMNRSLPATPMADGWNKYYSSCPHHREFFPEW